MWDSGISRNFGTIISESYWDILHMFTAGVCGKKKKGVDGRYNWNKACQLPLIPQRIIVLIKTSPVWSACTTYAGSECWADRS